ncbi:MAG: porin family protein, partial [Desulfuromonadales bacterium]|nr:porin family protein [Desulfuromonadales bacterium]
MKHLRVVAVLAALAGILLTAGPAAARNLANAFTLTPMIGGHVFEGNQPYDDDWTYGLALGYNYDQIWGTELLLFYTDANQSSPYTGSADIYNGMINGLYHFLPEGPLVPYVTFGLGAQRRDNDRRSTENDFLLNWGLGAKYFISQEVALRVDARHLIAFDQGLDEPSKAHNNQLYSAGLTFQFGAPAPAPEPT